MRTQSLLSGLVVILCGLVGCGGGAKEVPVYPVAGKVTINGRPAAGAQIIFHSATGDSSTSKPNAIVKPDGTFALTTRASGDGAPAGEYKVLVTLREQVGPPDDGKTRSVLPEKYAKPDLTPLVATIVKGPNQLDTFELTTR